MAKRTIQYQILEIPQYTYEIKVPSLWMCFSESFKGALWYVDSEDKRVGMAISLVESGAKYQPVKIFEDGREITEPRYIKEITDVATPSNVDSFAVTEVVYNDYVYNRYTVILSLIIGYEDGNIDYPKTKQVEYEVWASSERDAKERAKELDKSSYSIYESYVY